jgi:hypothetical protein
MAAFDESFRLRPNDPNATLAFASGLAALGRPAEALQTIVDALGRFPAWADDPRLLLRDGAACAAMNCADGKATHPPPPADRPRFRKQALDLLSTELAGLAKLAASDPEFVQAVLRRWRVDSDLESARPPSVKSLSDSTRLSLRSEAQ